jgi:hypothetical protein
MKDPLGRTAQKTVPAESIVAGDLIYTTRPEGDFTMSVESVSKGSHEGAEVHVWNGVVYKLEGSGAGPNPNFLGDMTGHRVGQGEWKMPATEDKQITKGVTPEEADYSY